MICISVSGYGSARKSFVLLLADASRRANATPASARGRKVGFRQINIAPGGKHSSFRG
jgi:hypothetical protein